MSRASIKRIFVEDAYFLQASYLEALAGLHLNLILTSST